MKLSLQKLTLIFLALFIANTTFAQEEIVDKVISLVEGLVETEDEEEDAPATGLTISGSADTYFRTNISGGSSDIDNGGTFAPATSFANLPGFSLGMANLIGTYEAKNSGVVVDLVFGPRGSDAVFASAPSANIVNQLYAYWNVSDNAPQPPTE